MSSLSRRLTLVSLSSALLVLPLLTAPPALGLSPGSPFGSVDSASARLGAVRLRGWMIDPNSTASGWVRIYVDGHRSIVRANHWRSDVARRYPRYGPRHGFDVTFSAAAGRHTVCVYALNAAGPGYPTRLSCRTVIVSGQPAGHLNGVSATDQGVQVSGWAIDPDTTSPVPVHVYVDAVGTPTVADVTRTDVAAAYPRYGAQHGFRLTVPASAGSHLVCVYALNTAGSGTTTALGCQRTSVPTFDDEFTGSTLDTAKWVPQLTSNSGYHTGPAGNQACYFAGNVSVSGGYLRLTARKEAAPFTCTSPTGDFTTQYSSGMVTTFGTFSQTYGRFEVRAKLPVTTAKGLQETLWLWPVNATEYGAYPSTGEIDFSEFYSQYYNLDVPYLHYLYDPGTVSLTTNTNVVTAYTCRINYTGFNTYALRWQPGTLTISVNGTTCLTDNYLPSGLTSPAPFDQPFFLALTQALGVGTNAFDPATTPLPATTLIDYVRIWK